jgi:ABC-type multidrug transport system permease subunit
MFGGYLVVIMIDTFIRVIKKKNSTFLLNIFIIPAMHACYALGTFVGFLKKVLN